jgi:hypothetical protein
VGRPPGRRVKGLADCGAAEPGPDNVLEEKLRQIDHEDSQLLTWDGRTD